METTYFDENNNPIKDIYLNKPQLCDLLGETYNTIRHWCNQFGKYLDADMSERNVKFNSADVELFKTIQLLLREENYTIKQVQVYLDENAENIKHGKMLNVDVSSNQLINKDMENLIREEVRNTVKESMNEFLSVMQQQLIQYVVQ